MENERLYMERTHDSLQLKYHLDALREEAAIQVTNIKDFSECQRLKYTDYIQKLEHQLAECRAMACSEFKKRDHVSILFYNIILSINSSKFDFNEIFLNVYIHMMVFNLLYIYRDTWFVWFSKIIYYLG